MATRTISVRVEAVVNVDTAEHLATVRSELAHDARWVVEQYDATVEVYHAGTVARRPGPNDGPLR